MVASFDEFLKIDIRVGKIIHVEQFPRANKPTYKVKVDFGPEIGIKWSSVQAAKEYTQEEMLDRQVVGIVNFAPKNIAGFMSEVLLLGVPAEEGGLSLLLPSRKAIIGGKVF